MLDTAVIPNGLYCYDVTTRQPCPYWSIDHTKPEQDNGHCMYMQSGDWDVDGVSLLWDAVKECGINTESEGPY